MRVHWSASLLTLGLACIVSGQTYIISTVAGGGPPDRHPGHIGQHRRRRGGCD